MFYKYDPKEIALDSYDTTYHLTFEKRGFTTLDKRAIEYVVLRLRIDGVDVYFKPCVGHNSQALKMFQ